MLLRSHIRAKTEPTSTAVPPPAGLLPPPPPGLHAGACHTHVRRTVARERGRSGLPGASHFWNEPGVRRTPGITGRFGRIGLPALLSTSMEMPGVPRASRPRPRPRVRLSR